MIIVIRMNNGCNYYCLFPCLIIKYRNNGAPRKDVSAPIGRIAGDAIVRDAKSADSITIAPISAEQGIKNL